MAKNTECSIWTVSIQKSHAFCLFSWCQEIFPFHFHGTNGEVLRNVQNQSIPYGKPYTQILHILPTTTNIISISEGVSFFDFLIFFSSFFIESNMIFFFIFETNPSSISFYILLKVRYKKCTFAIIGRLSYIITYNCSLSYHLATVELFQTRSKI